MGSLELEILSQVENATRTIFASIPYQVVHPIEHSQRVKHNTLLICEGDNIPAFVPLISAWLHDYGRPAEYLASLEGIKLNHAEESAKEVPILLEPFKDYLGEEVISEIQTAVSLHSKLNSPKDNLTTKILKDADRLDGLGSVGLYRTILSAPDSSQYNLPNPFPDKRIVRGNEIKSETTTTERMLYTIEWFAMLRMPTAIKIGLSRVQKQIGYLEGLVEELGLSKDLLEQNEIIVEARKTIQHLLIKE